MFKSLRMAALCYLVSLPLQATQWQGVLDWSKRTELTTAVNGVVNKVTVIPGERVKKGQLLLSLEQEAFRAKLTQRRAEVKHRFLLRQEASRELERAKELYERTLLADHDLNVAKVAYAEANAAYQTTRAALRQSEQDLKHSRLEAPFDAVVIDRRVQPAEIVVSSCLVKPLLTLAEAGRMKVRFLVQPSELARLEPGKAAVVKVGGKRYTGKIESIAFEPEGKQKRHYPVTVLFSTESQLRAGQPAEVIVSE